MGGREGITTICCQKKVKVFSNLPEECDPFCSTSFCREPGSYFSSFLHDFEDAGRTADGVTGSSDHSNPPTPGKLGKPLPYQQRYSCGDHTSFDFLAIKGDWPFSGFPGESCDQPIALYQGAQHRDKITGWYKELAVLLTVSNDCVQFLNILMLLNIVA